MKPVVYVITNGRSHIVVITNFSAEGTQDISVNNSDVH